TPFHLAIPVRDLAESRNFYTEVLNCEEGRSSADWVDYNFFGHQLVIHESQSYNFQETSGHVDTHEVPIPHFGVVLPWHIFEKFATDLESKNINFIIAPSTRFKDEPGEQKTMFFKDPSGNTLEFKSFRNMNQLFEK
ncbi:MAG: VOC family protein, partial [Psychroflexus sp.]|nr:VOC family protein [Psychroflexus sp.]